MVLNHQIFIWNNSRPFSERKLLIEQMVVSCSGTEFESASDLPLKHWVIYANLIWKEVKPVGDKYGPACIACSSNYRSELTIAEEKVDEISWYF